MSHRFFSIAPERLHDRLRSSKATALIDVRSPAEYRAGHIRGALSVPLDELDPQKLAERLDLAAVGTKQPLYLTCHAGPRAQQAAEKLHEAGYPNLLLVQGGTEAWEKAALPMRRCGNAISLERQVQIAVGALLILKVAFGFTVHQLFFVLGALIGAGLITAGITRWCGMARLIARMPWNRGRNCGEPADA